MSLDLGYLPQIAPVKPAEKVMPEPITHESLVQPRTLTQTSIINGVADTTPPPLPEFSQVAQELVSRRAALRKYYLPSQGNDLEPGWYKNRRLHTVLYGKDDPDTVGKAMGVSMGDFEWALRRTMGVDAETARKARDYALALGMNESDTMRNLPRLEEEVKVQGILKKLYGRDEAGNLKYQRTLSWLARPQEMLDAKDHILAMTQIEGLILDQYGGEWERQYQNMAETSKSMGRAVFQNIQDFAQWGMRNDYFKKFATIAGGAYKRELRERIPFLKKYSFDISTNDGLQELWLWAKKNEEAEVLRPTEVQNMKWFDQMMGVAPQVAVGTLATFLGGPLLAGLPMASYIQGSQSSQMEDQGIPFEQRLQASLINAAWQLPLEALQFSRALKLFKLKGLPLKTLGVKAGVLIAEEMGAEFLQSTPEEMTQIYGEMALHDDYPGGRWQWAMDQWTERMPKALKQGALEATYVAPYAFFGGGSMLANSYMDEKTHVKDEEYLDKLETQVKLSSLSNAKSETVERVIDYLAQKGPVRSVIIPAQEMDAFFFQNKNRKEGVLSAINMSEDAFDKETEKDGLIEIPVSTWTMSLRSSDFGEALNEYARYRNNSLSKKEMAAQRKMLDQDLTDIAAAYAELENTEKLPDEVFKIRKTLMSKKIMGVQNALTAEDADAQLAVFIAGATQISRASGQTLAEWFKRVKPTIKVFDEIGVILDSDKQIKGEEGRGFFDPTHNIIGLVKGADMSTFMHETMHLYMHDLAQLKADGMLNDDMKTVFDTLVDFAGGNLDKAAHEKIAKSFEKYLLEGKAPTSKLANAFAKFRGWLTAIYQTITFLDAEINDDIRHVFDRLLASATEISEAQALLQNKTSLAELLNESAEVKGEFKKLTEKAKTTALDRQVNTAMKAWKQSVGGVNAVRIEVKKQVESQQDYVAVDEIKAAGGLDIDEVEDRIGEDGVSALQRHGKNLVKDHKVGGKEVSLDEAVAIFNFDSVDEMLNKFSTMPTKQEAVKQEITARVSEVEKSLRDWYGREESHAGEEAVHNDAALAVMIAEAKMLNDKLSKKEQSRTKKLNEQAFLDLAKDDLASMPLKKAIKYSLHSSAEERIARKMYSQAINGQYKEASDTQDKRMYHHARVIESVKIREDLDAFMNSNITDKLKRKTAKIGEVYREAIKDIVTTYKLNDSDWAKPKKDTKTLKVPGIKGEVDVPRAGALPNIYKMVAPWILDKETPTGFSTFSDLSYNEMIDIRNAINAIIRQGKGNVDFLETQKAKDLAELVAEGIEAMRPLPDNNIRDLDSWLGVRLDKLDAAASELFKIEFVLENADAFQFINGGDFGVHRKLANQASELEGRYIEKITNIATKLKPVERVLGKFKKRMNTQWGGKNVGYIDGMSALDKNKTRGNDKYTAERLIVMMLNTGNQKNLDTLKRGWNLKDRDIDTLRKLFNDEEKAAFNDIWDIIDSEFEETDDTYNDIYYTRMTKEDALAVPELGLKGGYYPLRYDRVIGKTKADKDANAELVWITRDNAVHRSNRPRDGYVIERGEKVSLPILLNYNVLYQHLMDVTRFNTHARYLHTMNKLVNNTEWSDMFKQKLGRHKLTMLKNWLTRLGRPERDYLEPTDDVLNKMMRRSSMFILGYKTFIGLKQRLSFASGYKAMADQGGLINSAYYLLDSHIELGIGNLLFGSKRSKKAQFIADSSKAMKFRDRTMIREIRDAMAAVKPFDYGVTFNLLGKEHTFNWADVKDFAFWWIRANDMAVVQPIWLASYNMAMNRKIGGVKENMTEDEAHHAALEYADAIVRTSQPSAMVPDLSNLQARDGMIGLFTMFMTWVSTFNNRLIQSYKSVASGKASPMDFAKFVLIEAAVPTMIRLGLAQAFYDDDDDPTPVEWSLATPETMVSGIPVLREAGSFYKYQSNIGSSAAFAGLNELAEAGKGAKEAVFNDRSWGNPVWHLYRFGEWYFGIPISNPIIDAKRRAEKITGKDIDIID